VNGRRIVYQRRFEFNDQERAESFRCGAIKTMNVVDCSLLMLGNRWRLDLFTEGDVETDPNAQALLYLFGPPLSEGWTHLPN
jgi:hypothetical protein